MGRIANIGLLGGKVCNEWDGWKSKVVLHQMTYLPASNFRLGFVSIW